MKKILFIMLSILAMVGCQESMEDRAEREAKEYTKKYCPRVVIEQVMTLDSLTFDKAHTTFNNYYTVMGVADDRKNIEEKKDDIRMSFIKELHDDTRQRTFKDLGYSYRYILISQGDGSVLFDTTLKKEDYL